MATHWQHGSSEASNINYHFTLDEFFAFDEYMLC